MMRSGLRTAILPLFAVALSAGATTITVPGDYTLLQAGIDAAGPGDTVLVAAGTFDSLFYPPGVDTTRCVAYMKSGITLKGAGAGQTIVDAQSQGRGIYCNAVTGGRIEGFTLTGGFAQLYGGGIYCYQGSSPTIADCEITGNTDGGILCNLGSNPAVNNCQITGNVYKEGGGIALEDNSSPTFTGCTIYGNAAPAAGGIYVGSGSAPTFVDCVIDSNFLNTTSGSGGGIRVSSASITLRRCAVTRNVSKGKGGGMELADAAPVVIESTVVRGNTAFANYGPGGGIYAEGSNTTMTGCTITDNAAPGTDGLSDGGGIYAFFGTMSITACTIADNTTKSGGLGGGIYCWFIDPLIDRTILAFNVNGKGIHCDNATPVVLCTDLYGNGGGDAVCGTDSMGNFSEDPLFCDAAANDYGLRVDSPCMPGNHPTGAPCGQIGAHGLGECNTGVASGETDESMIPVAISARPNPFGPSTTIHFGLRRSAKVALAVYNLTGRRVRLLEEGTLPAGRHQAVWDARDDGGRALPSGVYFYRLEEGGVARSGRLVLTR